MKYYNNNNQLLVDYAIKNNIIDPDTVLTHMKKKILSQHNNAIYQQKDGRWCTYIKEDGKRKAIRVKTKEELENRLCKYYSGIEDASSKKNISLESLFEEWIVYKSKHVKKQTILVFRSIWNTYYKGSHIVSIPIGNITKLMLDEWIHETIRQHEMTKHKYTNFISLIKQELNYAVDREIISSNPYNKVKVDTKRMLQPEIKKADSQQVFSPEEELFFRNLAFSEFKNNVYPINQLVPIAALFLFYTGLRVGELCALRFSDITGDYIHVQRSYNACTKKVEHGLKAGHSERTVPLVDEAKEIIQMAINRQIENGTYNDTSYIFSLCDRPLSYQATRELFYKYCKIINSYPKGPHCARKTFISRLIDAGVNLNTICKIVGHRDERTTLKNYCFDRRKERDVYDSVCKAFS